MHNGAPDDRFEGEDIRAAASEDERHYAEWS